jgi:hypothetical protein
MGSLNKKQAVCQVSEKRKERLGSKNWNYAVEKEEKPTHWLSKRINYEGL